MTSIELETNSRIIEIHRKYKIFSIKIYIKLTFFYISLFEYLARLGAFAHHCIHVVTRSRIIKKVIIWNGRHRKYRTAVFRGSFHSEGKAFRRDRLRTRALDGKASVVPISSRLYSPIENAFKNCFDRKLFEIYEILVCFSLLLNYLLFRVMNCIIYKLNSLKI